MLVKGETVDGKNRYSIISWWLYFLYAIVNLFFEYILKHRVESFLTKNLNFQYTNLGKIQCTYLLSLVFDNSVSNLCSLLNILI